MSRAPGVAVETPARGDASTNTTQDGPIGDLGLSPARVHDPDTVGGRGRYITMARKVVYTRILDAAHAALTAIAEETEQPISAIIAQIVHERLGMAAPARSPSAQVAAALKARTRGKAA